MNYWFFIGQLVGLLALVNAEENCWLRCQDYRPQVLECDTQFCWTDEGAIYSCLRGTEQARRCAFHPMEREKKGLNPIQGCPFIYLDLNKHADVFYFLSCNTIFSPSYIEFDVFIVSEGFVTAVHDKF